MININSNIIRGGASRCNLAGGASILSASGGDL